jgi:AmmeMemoRadiSam system protein A
VGQTGRSHSLGEVVARCAISAVLHDPRLPAVRADEVAELEIEISVLSEMRPIFAEAIEAGTHGVLVIRGERRALLLPQVAAERNWPVERFLEETCRKAGLPLDAWRDPETKLLGFAAEIFSERDLREPAFSVAG